MFFFVIPDVGLRYDSSIYKSIRFCICYISFNVLLGASFSFALVMFIVFLISDLRNSSTPTLTSDYFFED